MKELGAYFHETRVANGVSLDEAASDLDLQKIELENIEIGNVRAFKDVYTLKTYVKKYAKYLGLDPEKVLDEFNDFLFEHTSKISIDDILEAQTKKLETVKKPKKVTSPYTNIKVKKVNYAPIALITMIIILTLLIVYLLARGASNDKTISSELAIKSRIGVMYEFTY